MKDHETLLRAFHLLIERGVDARLDVVGEDTLNGAVVFPIFAALYYWLPKMTGRMLSERLGKWSFWTMFVGFNVSFFPMHLLGLMGMQRRIFTYSAGLGWGTLNAIVAVRGAAFGLGTGITLDRPLSNAHAINAVVHDSQVTTAGYQGTPAPNLWFGGPAVGRTRPS